MTDKLNRTLRDRIESTGEHTGSALHVGRQPRSGNSDGHDKDELHSRLRRACSTASSCPTPSSTTCSRSPTRSAEQGQHLDRWSRRHRFLDQKRNEKKAATLAGAAPALRRRPRAATAAGRCRRSSCRARAARPRLRLPRSRRLCPAAAAAAARRRRSRRLRVRRRGERRRCAPPSSRATPKSNFGLPREDDESSCCRAKPSP